MFLAIVQGSVQQGSKVLHSNTCSQQGPKQVMFAPTEYCEGILATVHSICKVF